MTVNWQMFFLVAGIFGSFFAVHGLLTRQEGRGLLGFILALNLNMVQEVLVRLYGMAP